MLVKVMLPVFRTVPLKVNEPPGNTWVAGQIAVTTICGVVVIKQVVLTAFVTATPQMLRPVAVEVLVVKQLVGAR
jgi:hypothetical protein